MKRDWPFDDPDNVAVITTRRIAEGQSKILYVIHDAADSGWQFLEDDTPRESDTTVIGLGQVMSLDPTVCDLADLPLGWVARRTTEDAPWKRGLG